MNSRATPNVVGFDAFYGLELIEMSPESARGQLEIDERHKQPWGVVHGGVYAAIAEALASYATGVEVAADGMLAAGMSNHTSFLRPLADGSVHAQAVRKHRGRTSWVWEVEMTDDAGKLCALSRVTVAVRKPK